MHSGPAGSVALPGRTLATVLEHPTGLLQGRLNCHAPGPNGELVVDTTPLLDIIAASDAMFLRNDKELSGAAFAAYLRRKHQHYGSENASVDEFIAKTPSRSISTGNPYRARLPGGDIVEVAVWLREQAAGMTRKPQEAE